MTIILLLVIIIFLILWCQYVCKVLEKVRRKRVLLRFSVRVLVLVLSYRTMTTLTSFRGTQSSCELKFLFSSVFGSFSVVFRNRAKKGNGALDKTDGPLFSGLS